MPNVFRLTALAMARALLAGEQEPRGLAARLEACLGERSVWTEALARRIAQLPGEQWRRLSPRTLASLVEHDEGYHKAWQGEARPYVRRYLLRENTRLAAPPLGLETCLRPHWPTSAALATWLGLSDGALWRLVRPAAWQRGLPLGDQHYRNALLAKRNGGWRLLEVPHPYLKSLQRRLLESLIGHVPTHEAACAYVRGRRLLDHVREHSGQAVVMRFDLQDFFSSVRAARVQALFATLGYPEPVARALTALVTVSTPEPVLQRLREQGGFTWRQAQRLRDAHLPQGAPTSPALANLCAFRLDLRLAGLAQCFGARYTRYADDIVLSGEAALKLRRDRLETWVGRIAHEEGFALNHRKTRCLPAARRQTVCGVVVNRGTRLPREDFDRLKAILHQCVRDGPSTHRADASAADWRARLEGRVAWAAQLDAAKAQRLRRLLDRIDWQR
jgi:RNA-directed DNA polymerase